MPNPRVTFTPSCRHFLWFITSWVAIFDMKIRKSEKVGAQNCPDLLYTVEGIVFAMAPYLSLLIKYITTLAYSVAYNLSIKLLLVIFVVLSFPVLPYLLKINSVSTYYILIDVIIK